MPAKVVFIDDEPDICEIFTECFAMKDLEIRTFTDPLLALQSIKQDPPDMVFVDFRLPSMTGDDVARLMGPGIPVILLTGDLEVKTSQPFMMKLSKQPFPWTQIEAVLQSLTAKLE